MYLYSASKDPQWLDVAWSVLNSLEALYVQLSVSDNELKKSS